MAHIPQAADAIEHTVAAIAAINADQTMTAAGLLQKAMAITAVAGAYKGLSEAFPNHGLAVFTREDDQPGLELMQLLADPDVEGAQDYDAAAQAGAPAWMSPEQWQALVEADRLIGAVGSDSLLLEHLDGPEAEHRGWTEIQMPLKNQTEKKD